MESIHNFRNKHSGDRIFIIGNGPSLSDTPLDRLKNEYTMATNAINNIYDETKWRPTYYCLAKKPGTTVERSDIEEIIEYDTTCFINKERNYIPNQNRVFKINVETRTEPRIECLNDPYPPEDARDYWSDEVHDIIYLYNASIYPLYQIANYMGFDNIYLLGCDLGMDANYQLFPEADDPVMFRKKKQTRFDSGFPLPNYTGFIYNSDSPIKSLLNLLYVEIGNKNRLFVNSDDPYLYWEKHEENRNNDLEMFVNYIINSESKFKSGIDALYSKLSGNLPRPISATDPHLGDGIIYKSKSIRIGEDDRQRRAHNLAREKLSERGVEIYNATIGGELEVHPRVDINEII